MKATFFIVMLWLHNDQFHTTVVHVPECPPKAEVERSYDNLLAQNEFHEIKACSALCTIVNFDLPKKEPEPLEKELKV